jgi:thiamine pyrophosphate-dependent acetolactate synthase large subunit-like protein
MLNRRALVADLLKHRSNELLVTGLGSSTYDAAAAGDNPLSFYLWGAMGSAAMVGLGLALAQPKRRVVVITGDGELLMGLGSLATIGARKPANLAILVLDNEAFGETGRQAGLTGEGVDLCAIAEGAGLARTLKIERENDTGDLAGLLYRAPGPVLAVAKIATDPDPMVLPERDGRFLVQRFRAALLGPGRATS